jgi:dTDP-4-dehydrorhamnose reductase
VIRIAVTGKAGQVATALAERAAAQSGVELVLLGRPEMDLTEPASVETAITGARPDLVVNAAAWTAVDKAEAEEDAAFAVNRDGAAAVARAARAAGAGLIHISTDYVFSGENPRPWRESDPTGPLNAYGRSKLAGEQAVRAEHENALILRTAWVFSPFGANFVKTMLRLCAERDVLRIVDDQHGNPTGAFDIADAILCMAPPLASGEPGGVYHYCCRGSTTWHGFAREIFRQAAAAGVPTPRLEAVSTSEFPTPARRPANSRLDTAAFEARFAHHPRKWQDSLAETLSRLLA